MSKRPLTAARLRDLLDYDPETGVFVWKVRRGGTAVPGSVAGRLDKYGHRVITVHHQQHLAHRLAWLFVHGEWPAMDLDHRNGAPDDNRLDNLREASRTVNCQNVRRSSRTQRGELMGVTEIEGTDGIRFAAQISVPGRNIYLGMWDTAKEAHAAYVTAKRLLHDGSTI